MICAARNPRALNRVRGRAGNDGFSLIELMITAVIIGILLAIAMPAYNQYLILANKSAAKAVLMDVFSRQEQYVMKAGRYTCSNPATSPPDSDQTPTCTYAVSSNGQLALLGYTVPAEVTNYFDITLTVGTNSGSTVAALQGMPTFTISASGKVGTIQDGQPAAGASTAYSINQFGLKLPVSAW